MKLIQSKQYKGMLCWQYEDKKWSVEASDNGLVNSFAECKKVINNMIDTGTITIL